MVGGLRFPDGPDGIFHLPIGVLDYLLGLLMGFFQDAAAHALDVFQLLLVTVREAFQRLVCGPDLGKFFVQGPAAAGNLAEVALNAHELLSGPLLRILHDGLRHTHLPGQLKGEGRARQALLQHEERRHGGRIKLHGPIDNAGLCPRGI